MIRIMGGLVAGTILCLSVAPAFAERGVDVTSASGERLSMAMGHYSRARALLIAALREFDEGSKLARADTVIDAREWRDSVVTRAEDLQHVIDPQPRASFGGVRYEPIPEFLEGNTKGNRASGTKKKLDATLEK